MKRHTMLRVGMLAAVTFFLATSPTLSQVQNTGQRRCIVAMNRAFDGVGRAQAAVHKECVRRAMNDQLAPETLHQCLQSDPRGDVAEAKAATVAAQAQYCGSTPDFGYVDAATVNAAAVIDEQQMIYGLLGPGLNTAIIPKTADPQRAQCLLKVVRGVERIMKKKRIEFKKCKNEGIREGVITSQDELEECYVDVKLDVRQKIVKPIAWLERAVATYCTGQGVNPDTVMPGRCVGAPDFTQCGNEFTDCRICVSQNTADDLDEDCDIYDNGVDDDSCLPVECGNGVTEINEICDDTNTLDGDCCSSTCTYESSGSPCTDGNLCTDDSCDGAGTCVSVNNSVPCTDGLFCNGDDTCGGGSCSIHAGDPCASGTECADACNEVADNCFDPAATACTDDGNVCTDDECDGLGACVHPNNSAPCTDNIFCNGTDTCSGGTCSIHTGDPCPGPDGDGNCSESCDEGADNCLAPDTDGTVCIDGLFCTATDLCSSGTCVGSVDPCPGPDGDGDCTESCNEGADNCTAADPNATPCTDGLFCTAVDSCSAGTCVGVGDPCPGPDGDVDCSESCNEPTDDCTFNDVDGTACTDDGDICTDDLCSAGGCTHPQTGACKYVTPTGTGTACTQGSPCSLTTGLSQVAAGFQVRAASGTYTLSNELTNIGSNVRLRGGYDAGTWLQTAGCTATHIARDASNPDGTANVDQRIVAVQLSSVSGFNVECLRISTANATGTSGMSTYGVHLNTASNYAFVDVTINAGNAAPGAAGAAGATGLTGGIGLNGTAGLADGSSNRPGGGGGPGAGAGGGLAGSGALTTASAGGDGGDSSNVRGGGGGGGGGAGGFHASGTAGGQGGGVNGGVNQTNIGGGGAGGNCVTSGVLGGGGGTGANGSTGANGGAGSAGSRSTFWNNGGQGGTGVDGSGGRGGTGGGGGGGQDDPAQPGPSPTCRDGVGGGGGGGAGGGQGGTGGTGGRGGGSSYAVYLVNNGVGGVFTAGARTAGTAGAGGSGGSAGTGGPGGTRGTGGTGGAGIGAGGDGGFGGNAGNGGAGGAGTAGESVAVVTVSGTAPTINP